MSKVFPHWNSNIQNYIFDITPLLSCITVILREQKDLEILRFLTDPIFSVYPLIPANIFHCTGLVYSLTGLCISSLSIDPKIRGSFLLQPRQIQAIHVSLRFSLRLLLASPILIYFLHSYIIFFFFFIKNSIL